MDLLIIHKRLHDIFLCGTKWWLFIWWSYRPIRISSCYNFPVICEFLDKYHELLEQKKLWKILQNYLWCRWIGGSRTQWPLANLVITLDIIILITEQRNKYFPRSQQGEESSSEEFDDWFRCINNLHHTWFHRLSPLLQSVLWQCSAMVAIWIDIHNWYTQFRAGLFQDHFSTFECQIEVCPA